MSNSEIVSIVDAISRDKGIPKEQLIIDVEKAIEEVGKKKYGAANVIKAKLDRKTGEILLYRVLDVVDELDDYINQILLKDAQKTQPDIAVGDKFYDILPPIDIGRSEAMLVKNSITSAVKNAERQREYEDFIGRNGQLITGIVKRIEYGHIIVDLGRAEALLKRDQLVSSDRFKIGDRVMSYIQDVKREEFGAQIFLSRTHEQMVAKLFERDVPEVAEGLVRIKDIVRDAGSRSKVAVFSVDSGSDAVAACVGIRGTRIKSIMNELNGEKIDVFAWNIDLGKYVIAALGLNINTKIIAAPNVNKVTVLVDNDQLSSVIGRGGQNVKLASKIAKCSIEVLTEDVQSKRQLEEFYNVSQSLINSLDLDETLGQFLVAKGFSSAEQIANTGKETLLKIEGFDEELALELLSRAQAVADTNRCQITAKLDELGVEADLIQFLNFIDLKLLLNMAEHGIKSIEDIACCSLEDIKKIAPSIPLNDSQILAMIQEAKLKESSIS